MEQKLLAEGNKIPTRAMTHETAVIDIPITELWSIFKEFDLARLFPTFDNYATFIVLEEILQTNLQIFIKRNQSDIKVCKLDSQDVGKVGATTKAHFFDGDYWVYQILELSDADHIITYDVIEAGDPITWSTQISTFKLHKITENNTTFVEWDTFYSNDVDISVINANVKKKMSHFVDMRKALQKK